MSAAVLMPMWGARLAETVWQIDQQRPARKARERAKSVPENEPEAGLAFYRRHTESLLRRYLYASTQVGRAPSALSEPVSRGWASSRPIRSFEDAIIFVLDIERCIDRLDWLEKELVSRIVLQEYTQSEVAGMLGMCVRTVSSRLAKALDRLTDQLLTAGLLILPK